MLYRHFHRHLFHRHLFASMRAASFSGFLVLLALLLLALMALGAATRLTGSGLSMTTWQPVFEFPPHDAQGWQETFERYRHSAEGQSVNRGISLEGFQRIYWWEWGHRFLARSIALFLLALLLWQAVRRNTERVFFLCSLLGLVALQGLLGWWMVRSGLREVARVSPYFLMAHLSVALLVLLLVVRCLFREHGGAGRRLVVSRGVRLWSFCVALLSLLPFVSGAFVAGLRAGGIHNDWPLMSGRLVPSDYALLEPWWRNALENPSAVQFEHRCFALLLLLCCFGLFWILRGCEGFCWHARVVLFLPLVQALLGGLVLLLHVPVFLGVVHHVLGVCLVVVLFALCWRQVSERS